MLRKIIKINQETCNGCGLCAAACHEGAIGMVDGKARLLREDYCDGLGDCLPACPVNAITFEEREAPAYDHAAVMAAKAALPPLSKGTPGWPPLPLGGNSPPGGPHSGGGIPPLPCGCPGSMSRTIASPNGGGGACCASDGEGANIPSQLRQWPVQLKLVPVSAPYFNGADILFAADCTAFAYGAFHRDFIKGKIVLVGCPKLDEGDYAEKLTAIFAQNDIKSVTVARMEVPCCAGLQLAAETAVAMSGKDIPLKTVVIGVEGGICG